MKLFSYLNGIVLCIIISIIAIFLANYIAIGAVAITIILGIIIGNTISLSEKFEKGIKFSEKHILSLAIALMGLKLNFMILKKLGIRSILLVVIALTVTLTSSLILSKIFKFNRKFSLLLGIGNGVCGSSAIAATEKIIGNNEEEVGLSVAIVNFLGTIGIFLIPFIGKIILHFSNINAGILAGNTLQAVGQVVAAGFSISENSGQIATIIKMTRILMLFPLVFILIFSFKNKENRDNTKIKKPKLPIFIIGFILFSLIPTFKLISLENIKILSKFSHYFLVIAMSAIGMKITFKSILKDGKKALIIGILIFMIQIIFSSFTIFLFF